MKHAITAIKSLKCTEIPVLWLLCKNSLIISLTRTTMSAWKKWRFEHYSVITDITTQASFQSDTGVVHIIPRKWPLLQHACSVMSSFARSLCISRIYRSAYIMHCVYITFVLYNCQKNKGLKSLSCKTIFKWESRPCSLYLHCNTLDTIIGISLYS